MATQLLGVQMVQETAMVLVTAVISQVDGMQIEGIAQIAGSRDITIWIAPAISKAGLRTESKIGDGTTHLCLPLKVGQRGIFFTALLDSILASQIYVTRSFSFQEASMYDMFNSNYLTKLVSN